MRQMPPKLNGVRLACKAFYDVFQSKQTRHAVLLEWLSCNLAAAWPASRAGANVLTRAAGDITRTAQGDVSSIPGSRAGGAA